ncbi:protein WVD2-like 5 isoform X2 [Pistacia vera]|uniref:protein WVD2-like 5 isoform X2 n=1 Tax=Pistacia vera TaxID=55513 RepID=UPI001263806C|nr:protein WVD2-like 5 isoform X2 [Pistacia vera]
MLLVFCFLHVLLKCHLHYTQQEGLQLFPISIETQDAEIKMLRKSLTFKATRIPSFYQELPPPTVELKKAKMCTLSK